jgi:prolyl oligopeptidase
MSTEIRNSSRTRRLKILILFTAVLSSGAAVADASDEFAVLLEDAWQFQMREFPEFASYLGDRRYNDKWTDQSLPAIQSRHEHRLKMLERLHAIDPNALSAADRINYELFERELTSEIDSFQYRGFLQPFSQRGGIQTQNQSTRGIPQATVKDYEDWLTRMSNIDEDIEQTIALAELGRKKGIVSPTILMRRVPAQIETQLVENGEDSPFYEFFDELPESFSADDTRRLQAAAVTTIEDTVVPAYRNLARYFNETYLPATRSSIGLSDLPMGQRWYESLVRDYTTTRMTPEEIHQLGLAEVERIRGEMQLIIDELEFEGDFQAFLTFLRTDPQFYFDNPDDLYTAYLATAKRIDPELVKLFGKLPRMPYGVQEIPAATAPDTTTAYYTQPAGDGSRAGIYWVNLYKPEVRPKFEIEVLTVHEAMPGNHLQLALQQEMGDMPMFRRFSGFTAFVEGWGLYSESLGYELGLYKDAYSRFGALTYEMWRAVRLVVDTGMHYKGWSRQQAIDFFKANAAKTEHDIVNEIDRYIGNPGQALAYKVGQLKIQSLRTRAEETLGEDFDIRAFHDELLGAGALPLDMLEQRMRRWLEQQQ